MLKIIAQKDETGNWAAWGTDHPEIGFGGDSAAIAVTRLLEAVGENVDSWAADYTASGQDRIEFFRVGGPCPDCNGSGRYVGLLAVEDCGLCRGSGLA